jgi:predicted transcriptional regulator
LSQSTLEEIVSSKARLKIASLISIRPRTLRELSNLTGISIQGVLKHLDKLRSLGIVGEKKVAGGSIPVRKLYSIKGVHVGDFSQGDLTVVRISSNFEKAAVSSEPVRELESAAADMIIQKRRIKDQARRLARIIDELVNTETRIDGVIRGLNVHDDERLLLHTSYTEESLEEAERTLREHYGLKDARRALEKAIAGAGRIGKK